MTFDRTVPRPLRLWCVGLVYNKKFKLVLDAESDGLCIYF